MLLHIWLIKNIGLDELNAVKLIFLSIFAKVQSRILVIILNILIAQITTIK
jgi:hypothetical protein